jgi:hypothetical protein
MNATQDASRDEHQRLKTLNAALLNAVTIVAGMREFARDGQVTLLCEGLVMRTLRAAIATAKGGAS